MRRMQYSPRAGALSTLALGPHTLTRTLTRQRGVDGIGTFFYTPGMRSARALCGNRQGA
jgi:hypothetical protein